MQPFGLNFKRLTITTLLSIDQRIARSDSYWVVTSLSALFVIGEALLVDTWNLQGYWNQRGCCTWRTVYHNIDQNHVTSIHVYVMSLVSYDQCQIEWLLICSRLHSELMIIMTMGWITHRYWSRPSRDKRPDDTGISSDTSGTLSTSNSNWSWNSNKRVV